MTITIEDIKEHIINTKHKPAEGYSPPEIKITDINRF